MVRNAAGTKHYKHKLWRLSILIKRYWCASVKRSEKTLLKFKHCARYKAAFYVTVVNRFVLNVVSSGWWFLGLHLVLCRHFDTSLVPWLRVLTGYACNIATFSTKQGLHLLELFWYGRARLVKYNCIYCSKWINSKLSLFMCNLSSLVFLGDILHAQFFIKTNKSNPVPIQFSKILK